MEILSTKGKLTSKEIEQLRKKWEFATSSAQRPVDWNAYDQGYHNGSNSTDADWIYALEEDLGLEDVADVNDAIAKIKELLGRKDEPSLPMISYDIGSGRVSVGDRARYNGRECKVVEIYQDGFINIQFPTVPYGGLNVFTTTTVEWRYVTPIAS
jgi:hypothetical protein